jgi:hypothetical protein
VRGGSGGHDTLVSKELERRHRLVQLNDRLEERDGFGTPGAARWEALRLQRAANAS